MPAYIALAVAFVAAGEIDRRLASVLPLTAHVFLDPTQQRPSESERAGDERQGEPAAEPG